MRTMRRLFTYFLLLLGVLLGLCLSGVLLIAVADAPAHHGVIPSLMSVVRHIAGIGANDSPTFAGILVQNKDFQHLYLDKGANFNDGNTALGEDVMRYVHKSVGRNSQYNTGVGTHALRALTRGSDNTAVGAQALRDLTVGYHNTAVGHYALGRTTTGARNTALGVFSLNENRSGQENTAIGFQAMHDNASGHYNVALGRQALYNNHTGGYNVSLGNQALVALVDGNANTAVGRTSLGTLVSGEFNVGIGYDTGYGITTGSGNTILGSRVSGLPGDLSNNIILASGVGVIRAQHDGVGWSLVGPVHTSGGLRTEAEGEVLAASGGTERERTIHLGNAGGNFHVGVEGAVAGGYFKGSSAYANVLYSTGETPVEFIVAGGKRATVTPSGLEVNGSLSVAGGQAFAVCQVSEAFFQVTNLMYFITLTNAGQSMVKLPAGTPGRTFRIKNEGGGEAMIGAAECESLFTNRHVAEVALATGEAVELVWSGSHWSVLRFQ